MHPYLFSVAQFLYVVMCVLRQPFPLCNLLAESSNHFLAVELFVD